MRPRVFILILIAVVLLGGCAAFTELLSLKQKPDETKEAYEARKEAAKARVDNWTVIGVGLISTFWPAGVGFLATFLAMRKKYRHLYEIVTTVVGAIEDAEPSGHSAEAPVKREIENLNNSAVNRLVRDVVR